MNILKKEEFIVTITGPNRLAQLKTTDGPILQL